MTDWREFNNAGDAAADAWEKSAEGKAMRAELREAAGDPPACPDCDGIGTVRYQMQPCGIRVEQCEKCNGSGGRYPCPQCDGTGAFSHFRRGDWRFQEPCGLCAGSGQLQQGATN